MIRDILEGREDGKSNRDAYLHEKEYRLDAESPLCLCGPQHREGGLGTVLMHNGPHGGSCGQQHGGGDAGPTAWSHVWDPRRRDSHSTARMRDKAQDVFRAARFKQ